MQLTVLLFANLSELLGERSLTIEFDDDDDDDGDATTVRALLDALIAQHPALEPWADRIAVAVDEQYATRETILRDGQTIALIPPVSGG